MEKINYFLLPVSEFMNKSNNDHPEKNPQNLLSHFPGLTSSFWVKLLGNKVLE